MEVGRDYITLVAPGHAPALASGKVDLSPSFVVDATTLKGATFIAPDAGSASTATLTIGGTYVAGDVIKVTITSNDSSRQMWRKTYTLTVQAGSTATTAIAATLKNLIQADGDSLETPYNATVLASVVTVTAKEDDKHALLFFVSKTSTLGTIVASAVSTTISEGNPSDLLDKGVPASEITLASYDTVRILYEPLVAQPFIDTKVARQIELFWYGDPGEGAALETLINSL